MSNESTDTEVGSSKGLRTAPESGEGPRMEVDYGKGSASSQKAKKDSKERRKPKRRHLGSGGRDSSKGMFGQLLIAPLGNALTLEIFVAPSPVLLRQVFTTEVCQDVRRRAGPRQRAVRRMEPASGPRDPRS
jgi:hypothetical protein